MKSAPVKPWQLHMYYYLRKHTMLCVTGWSHESSQMQTSPATIHLHMKHARSSARRIHVHSMLEMSPWQVHSDAMHDQRVANDMIG